MKQTTICFLLKDDRVLLAMKKRGFGIGKWNGVGGKVEAGEDVKTAAAREIEEEIGVTVALDDLQEVGTLEFRFQDKPEWDNFCHAFVAKKWIGEPRESEEMRPVWYAQNKLPFESMWVDDPHWLPLVLAGKKAKGEFLFDPTGTSMLACDAKEIP